MLHDQLKDAIKDISRKLNCSPEELTMELISQLEVTVAEGNHVYGRKALTRMMETRLAQRQAIFLHIAALNQRQEEMFRRIEETRATLTSAVVLLRQRLGKVIDLPPELDTKEIADRFGLYRVDGTNRYSERRSETSKETPKEKA